MGRTHTASSISNMRANLANEGGARAFAFGANRISLLSHPHSGNFVPSLYRMDSTGSLCEKYYCMHILATEIYLSNSMH